MRREKRNTYAEKTNDIDNEIRAKTDTPSFCLAPFFGGVFLLRGRISLRPAIVGASKRKIRGASKRTNGMENDILLHHLL